ncbi:Dyp-type peroxidase [Micromonospora sp. NPDC049102]|uniref:Dyp-type peroxidase n=1 Tax=Micromonospora sp. NPDC049102 TaxID=3364265 RepID=UPI0037195EAC
MTLPPAGAVLAAFDVRVGDLGALADVLRRLSVAVGQVVGRFAGVGRLVEVTVAVGASLFDTRFGLGGHRPRGLVEMPVFPNDVLDPARCHGDLLLQVGAVDAATARSVVDELAGADLVPRWRVEGFRDENAVTEAGRASDRNLFGFREGAGNPDVRDEAEMDRLVWVGNGGGEPVWTAGGTYQVVRVIRFATALWDGESVGRQEAVFGRRKADGVPLSGEAESFDYRADPSGQLIALDAHIRRANPRTPETAGSRILRRGYSYRGGVDAAGRRDEGMLFVCFQQDVERGFATVQRRLAGEALDRYVLPVGGGYFFVLPGMSGSAGDYLGRALIDAAS